MKETERIALLFEELYDGESWVGESWKGTLNNVSAAVAAKRIAPQWHTVWEIVNHLISYRKNVLQRIQGAGRIKAPSDNYFSQVADQSEEAWQKTLQELKSSQEQWIAWLYKMDDKELDTIYTGNNSSYYKNIHGIIQHNNYHLGQVILLLKQP